MFVECFYVFIRLVLSSLFASDTDVLSFTIFMIITICESWCWINHKPSSKVVVSTQTEPVYELRRSSSGDVYYSKVDIWGNFSPVMWTTKGEGVYTDDSDDSNKTMSEHVCDMSCSYHNCSYY